MKTMMRVALGLLLVPIVTFTGWAADVPGLAGKLPKVLLIGDSISLGYTPVVQAQLVGVAEVSHPVANCEFTGYGLEHLKEWLGTNKWDVIHFNFGIWDTHLIRTGGALVTDESGPQPMPDTHLRYTPEQYLKNLTKIVEILQATGAKLIWASTTPVMARRGRRLDAIPNNNANAAKLMQARKIPLDDLYAYVLPHVKEWQGPDGCHFGAAGNEKLGQQVAASIKQALNAGK